MMVKASQNMRGKYIYIRRERKEKEKKKERGGKERRKNALEHEKVRREKNKI